MQCRAIVCIASIHYIIRSMKKIMNKCAALALLFLALGFTACEKDKLVEGEPVLTLSKTLVLADGKDEVVMKVTVGGVDVTKNATFYKDELSYDGNTFSTNKPGDYVFYAVYNNQNTKAFAVKAADPRLYVALPEDSKADQFTDFGHKVLLTQGTGTWCGFCPYMIRAIELFRAEQSNADKVVVVATHGGDNLSNKASEAVVKACRITGFPSSVFNLNYEALLENNESSLNAVKINSMANMELMEDARVGISSVVRSAGNKVSVRSAIKVGETGAYRINAWLVEDGVKDVQQSYLSDFPTAIIDHNFVLRDASCITPVFGGMLGGKEQCDAGETIEFYHEFDGKAAGVSNVANCKVVVLVSAMLEGSVRYAVNNVVECPVGGVVPFAYN